MPLTLTLAQSYVAGLHNTIFFFLFNENHPQTIGKAHFHVL
jgi:hypothetical protein